MERYLYKAKRVDTKEWIIGNYMFPDQIYDYINKIAYRIEPETVRQCTGLRDRKGNLIWENDIMMAHLDESYPEDTTYKTVEWGAAGWITHEADSIDRQYLDEFDLEHFEVVYDLD